MPFDHFGVIAPIFSRVEYSSLDMMLEQADLPTSGRVLDAGGGTGRVANAIREHAGDVVIADPSLGMLRQADRTQLGLACSNSEALPFPNDFFDRIIMVDALHHVYHQGQTACEMYRVLKPGGRIVIEEPDIRKFGVKLIAVAEKLLLMRSHFLAPQKIVDLFSFDSAKANIHATEGNAWVVIEKPG
ncbi:MAG: methyltransferase domain-containing protein [Anaerolineales bacterium]|jgi:demethylmenaquinone methyltransferase/2-methoxy-6-polyprenyl-1,4-benzoquinol methylase